MKYNYSLPISFTCLCYLPND